MCNYASVPAPDQPEEELGADEISTEDVSEVVTTEDPSTSVTS